MIEKGLVQNYLLVVCLFSVVWSAGLIGAWSHHSFQSSEMVGAVAGFFGCMTFVLACIASFSYPNVPAVWDRCITLALLFGIFLALHKFIYIGTLYGPTNQYFVEMPDEQQYFHGMWEMSSIAILITGIINGCVTMKTYDKKNYEPVKVYHNNMLKVFGALALLMGIFEFAAVNTDVFTTAAGEMDDKYAIPLYISASFTIVLSLLLLGVPELGNKDLPFFLYMFFAFVGLWIKYTGYVMWSENVDVRPVLPSNCAQFDMRQETDSMWWEFTNHAEYLGQHAGVFITLLYIAVASKQDFLKATDYIDEDYLADDITLDTQEPAAQEQEEEDDE